ncbi:MAG TPA: helix-turn-helix domain-containing protein [Candidatus Limnocylindria bacterium]|nr:helix-turn-helix domain-containing protein [Candidatus Limnocylindria bacterium]
MNRSAKQQGRTYRSKLRADQAEETRRRILDALVEVMAGGVASVSIPAVARRAGVSVPTVYRHFGSKRALFAALYPHVVYRGAMERLPLPDSLDGLGPGLRRQFAHLDAIGDVERAAMLSPAGAEARRSNMPSRIERTRRLTDAIVPAGSTIDRERLTRLLVILTGGAAFRTWRDDLGCSPDEAADDVEWAIRTLIDASARNQ